MWSVINLIFKKCFTGGRTLCAGLYWEAGPVTVLLYDPIFCPVQLFPRDDQVFWLDTENSEASECNKLEHQHHRHHHHHQSCFSPLYRPGTDVDNSSRYISVADLQRKIFACIPNFSTSLPCLMSVSPPIIKRKRLISPDEK